MEKNEEMLEHHGIKGMHWGVRRYQNKDGTLTKAGQARYDRDKRENSAKKIENRIDTIKPDPKRWVREDLERSKKIVDSVTSVTKEISKIEQETSPKLVKKSKDLSNKSDKELRDKINRELLEQQYNKLFSEISAPEISRGRQFVKDTLSVAGDVLAVIGSALTVALAIKELRG